MESRNARIAENEALFRAINERMTAWPERRAAPATEKLGFYCECGDPTCFERICLTGPEYELVREDPGHFAVVAGHVFPEAERVVEEHEGYVVVQKNEDVRGLVERADPRRGPDS